MVARFVGRATASGMPAKNQKGSGRLPWSVRKSKKQASKLASNEGCKQTRKQTSKQPNNQNHTLACTATQAQAGGDAGPAGKHARASRAAVERKRYHLGPCVWPAGAVERARPHWGPGVRPAVTPASGNVIICAWPLSFWATREPGQWARGRAGDRMFHETTRLCSQNAYV